MKNLLLLVLLLTIVSISHHFVGPSMGGSFLKFFFAFPVVHEAARAVKSEVD